MTNEQQSIEDNIRGCIRNLFTVSRQFHNEEIDTAIEITRRLQPRDLNEREYWTLHSKCRAFKALPELIENTYESVRKELNESNLSMRQLNIEEVVEGNKNDFLSKLQEILSWCEEIDNLTRYSEGETISQDIRDLSKLLEEIRVTVQKFHTDEPRRPSGFLDRYQASESQG